MVQLLSVLECLCVCLWSTVLIEGLLLGCCGTCLCSAHLRRYSCTCGVAVYHALLGIVLFLRVWLKVACTLCCLHAMQLSTVDKSWVFFCSVWMLVCVWMIHFSSLWYSVVEKLLYHNTPEKRRNGFSIEQLERKTCVGVFVCFFLMLLTVYYSVSPYNWSTYSWCLHTCIHIYIYADKMLNIWRQQYDVHEGMISICPW